MTDAPPSLNAPGGHELAAEEPFVRALAQRLVQDEADEVVQQTYLRALARTPAGIRSPRRWLARILRNVVTNMRRSSTRRSTHERRSAIEDIVPSSAELAIREERRRALVTAVDGLPEPLRTIVWLRFFENWRPGHIARELELPPATVWEYQRRALDLLRKRLDRDYGSRKAWLAPLVPMAVRPHTPPFDPTLLTPTLLTMTAKTKLLGIAGVLSVGALCYWVAATATATVSTTTENTTPHAALQSGARTESASTSSAADDPRERIASRKASAWTVRGKVLDDEEPHPGVAVRAALFRGYTAKGEPLQTAQLRSGADGSFAWPLAKPEHTVTIQLQAEGDKLLAWAPVERFVIQGDPAPTDLVVQAYRLEARMSGQVVDEQGRGIGGATLFASRRQIVTDADGRFDLEIPAWSFYQFSVGARGYGYEYTSVQVDGPNTHAKITVRLRRAQTLRGRVIDERNQPIAGVRVTTTLAAQFPAVTDAGGNFVIDWASPGETVHWLYAKKTGYATTLTKVDSNTGKDRWDIVLARGETIRGTVFGPGQAPARGAKVKIAYTSPRTLDAIADDDGKFELHNVPARTYRLTAYSPGLAMAVQDVTVKPNHGAELQVFLQPGRIVTGTVETPSGEPIAAARVRVLLADDQYTPSIRTDDAGRFELRDMPHARIQVSAVRKGYTRAYVRSEPGNSSVRIVLKPAGLTAGRVIDKATGKPIPAYRIYELPAKLEKGEKAGVSLGFGDAGKDVKHAAGVWRSQYPSPPGSVLGVMVRADGYAPGIDRRVIAKVDPQPDDCVIALTPAATIRGRVLDPQGRPIQGATLFAATKDRPFDPTPYFSESAVGSATTGKDGSFELRDAPAGSVTLHARHPKWPPVVSQPFATTAGQTAVHDVSFHPSAVVEGTLRDEAGRPVTGGKLVLTAERVPGVERGRDWEVVTDARGQFRIASRLTGGTYRLGVSMEAKQLAHLLIDHRLEVRSGERHPVQLRPAGNASIQIAPTQRTRAAWVHVGAVDAAGKLRRDRPNRYFQIPPSGITLRGFPPGRYRLRSWIDEKNADVFADVNVGAPTRIELPVDR